MRPILAGVNSVAFRATLRRARWGAAGEPLGTLGCQNLRVWAARPGNIRIEADEGEAGPGGMCAVNPFRLFVSNGRDQVDVAPESGFYLAGPAANQLVDVTSARGLAGSVPLELLFGNRCPLTVRRTDTAGPAEAGGIAHVRPLGWRGVEGEERVFLEAASGLPLRVSAFVSDGGAEREVSRVDFASWQMEPTTPPETFEPLAPPTFAPLRAPYVPKPGYFLAGDVAPEVTVDGTTDGEISVSRLRGRFVLVCISAAWCTACTELEDTLAPIYARLRPRGFEIIQVEVGVAADGTPRAPSPLAPKPWLQLVESIPPLRRSVAERFGATSVPHTVLVDPEGRVRMANPRPAAILAFVESAAR